MIEASARTNVAAHYFSANGKIVFAAREVPYNLLNIEVAIERRTA